MGPAGPVVTGFRHGQADCWPTPRLVAGPVTSSTFGPRRGTCCLFPGSGLLSSFRSSFSHFLTLEGQEVAKDHPQHTQRGSRAGRQPARSRFPARPGPPIPSGSCRTGCCGIGVGARLRPPDAGAPGKPCPRSVCGGRPRGSLLREPGPGGSPCGGRRVLSTGPSQRLGQVPAMLGVNASLCLARGVECPVQCFEMLGRVFTPKQEGQPPWAGPWACGGPSSLGPPVGQPREEALLICSHTCLGAGTLLARLREMDGAPESGLLLRTPGWIQLSGYRFGRWQLPKAR